MWFTICRWVRKQLAISTTRVASTATSSHATLIFFFQRIERKRRCGVSASDAQQCDAVTSYTCVLPSSCSIHWRLPRLPSSPRSKRVKLHLQLVNFFFLLFTLVFLPSLLLIKRLSFFSFFSCLIVDQKTLEDLIFSFIFFFSFQDMFGCFPLLSNYKTHICFTSSFLSG